MKVAIMVQQALLVNLISYLKSNFTNGPYYLNKNKKTKNITWKS